MAIAIQYLFFYGLLWTSTVFGKAVQRPSRGRHVPGRYMVKLKENCDVYLTANSINQHFKSDTNASALGESQQQPRVRLAFRKVFHGLSLERLSPAALAWTLENDCVEYVEEVGVVVASQSVGEDPDPVTMVDGNYQNWGLDRITEVVHDKNDYSYNPAGNGTNITIYIVDSGVRRTHLEFGGRAYFLNVFNDPAELGDDNGHGTQAAGIAIGTWRGTAREADVISVKVINEYGEGATDDLLAALIGILEFQPFGYAVVSMSFTSDTDYSYIHDAIIDLVNANFTAVAAAGNHGDNGCFYYPAGYPEVITVGAINAKGNIASFSNYGPCVDIYAPGANIYTATNEGDDQIKKMKGTSFAAPFVSGAAAILLEQGCLPADIKDTLISNSTKSVPIKYLPAGSYNRILYVEPAD